MGVDLGVSLGAFVVGGAFGDLSLAEFLGAGVDFNLELGVGGGGVFEGVGEGIVLGPGFFVFGEFVEDEAGDFEELVDVVVLCVWDGHDIKLCLVVVIVGDGDGFQVVVNCCLECGFVVNDSSLADGF